MRLCKGINANNKPGKDRAPPGSSKTTARGRSRRASEKGLVSLAHKHEVTPHLKVYPEGSVRFGKNLHL